MEGHTLTTTSLTIQVVRFICTTAVMFLEIIFVTSYHVAVLFDLHTYVEVPWWWGYFIIVCIVSLCISYRSLTRTEEIKKEVKKRFDTSK